MSSNNKGRLIRIGNYVNRKKGISRNVLSNENRKTIDNNKQIYTTERKTKQTKVIDSSNVECGARQEEQDGKQGKNKAKY